MLKPARKEFTLSIPTLSTLVGVAIALWSLIACGGGTSLAGRLTAAS